MDADQLTPELAQDAPRHSMQRLVVHLDLFSGIGGFALAAQMVGGGINVTREEFADIRHIMRGEPGCDVEEAKAVCQRLGLELDAMAFKRWTVKVVDEVKQRCEPPNDQAHL